MHKKVSIRRNSVLTVAVVFFILLTPMRSAAKMVKVAGKIGGADGFTVLLLAQNGRFRSTKLSETGKFVFRQVPAQFVAGATLQLVSPGGRYYGPIVLSRRKKKSQAYTTLTGKSRGRKIKLGRIALLEGYALAKKVRRPLVDRTMAARADAGGAPVGAGKLGFVQTVGGAARSGVVRAAANDETELGSDQDGDGIPNAADVDDDGDLNLDGSDDDSAGSSGRSNPFSTLFLSMSETLNANVTTITRAAIDAVIGGENKFNLIIYLSEPTAESVTGAHVICGSSLRYCRSKADGGGTAVFSGITGSDPSVLGGLWSDYDADGSGYPNLEPITSGSGQVYVASVQPRVGTDEFVPGDVYQVEYVDGDGNVVSSSVLTLAPYFVTVPALVSYDAGDGEVSVDYDDSNAPGTNSFNPMVLSSDGTLSLTFWRPQRLAVEGAESGEYRDMGRQHYGVIVGGGSGEFSCAGLYSNLSPTLEEDPGGLGDGGDPFAGSGASLWPLTDSSDDASPDPSSTLSFTVDLAACIARASVSSGTLQVSLTAAGEFLSGGANRAAQSFYITIP